MSRFRLSVPCLTCVLLLALAVPTLAETGTGNPVPTFEMTGPSCEASLPLLEPAT